MAAGESGQNIATHETGELQSSGRLASAASSPNGGLSASLSGGFHPHLPEGGEKETDAVGGGAPNVRRDHLTVSFSAAVDNSSDDGDMYNHLRRIGSGLGRGSSRGSLRWSGRIHADPGVVNPVSEEQMWPNADFSATLLASEILNPVSKCIDLPKEQVVKKEPPSAFDVAYLIHLAAFGILGVLTRYLLQKLFGPNGAGLTSDGTILYLDLPSNMVGSFLMGWFGCVFKENISEFSDQLAIGLSTGYLGSLTTFSGWNQKMLELSISGHWLFAVLGFLFGLLCSFGSLVFGVDTAEAFGWLFRKTRKGWRINGISNSSKRHMVILLVVSLMWIGLWTTSGILETRQFKDGGAGAQLWLGCLVGPFGVWIRWWLSRVNGRGLGSTGRWKWLPFGTLIANVSAACVMAALATVKKAVNTKDCDTVAAGIQLGLMGCLSTVSTFMAEFYKLKKDESHAWRAYAYAALTIGISFGLGTLIYSVPVWTKGYH